MTDQYVEKKKRVFNFDLKEESVDEWLTERGKEFPSWTALVPISLFQPRGVGYSPLRPQGSGGDLGVMLVLVNCDGWGAVN